MECFGMRLGPEEEVSEDENISKQEKINHFEQIHSNHSPRVQIMASTQPPEIKKIPNYEETKKQQPSQKRLNQIPNQTFSQQQPQINTGVSNSTAMKDIIVQQNTVNNDQSCQIIVNFYNLKCQSPPNQETPYMKDLQKSPWSKNVMETTKHLNESNSNENMQKQQIPVNKSRLSKILNSQNSVVAQFKKTISPRQLAPSVQSHGLNSVTLSANGNKNGSNPLTIEDQKMLFESEEVNSRPSEDGGNFSIPGEFNGLRITPKQAIKKILHLSNNAAARMMLSDSQPNFGSIIEKKQSPYNSFDQSNFQGTNAMSQIMHQKSNTVQNNTNQSLQQQLHQTTKQLFKSILYKNQMMSVSHNKHVKGMVGEQQSPEDLKIQSSYNSLQLKKKSAPGAQIGSNSSLGAAQNNGGFKSKKLTLIDSKQLETEPIFAQNMHNLGKGYYTHQKVNTVSSSGTMLTSMNNESLESIPVIPKPQNQTKQVKPQKIGSIISMKALRNDLMSQGFYQHLPTGSHTTQNHNKYPPQASSQYSLQKHQAQGGLLQKKRAASRNYALIQPNQYTEIMKRQFKSTEDNSLSPDVIKVIETKKQMSSRNHNRLHNTHSHQSSIKSIEEEKVKSSVISGNKKSTSQQRKNYPQYSETRLGSPKLSKRSMNNKKRLIISPNQIPMRSYANHHLLTSSATSDARPDSSRELPTDPDIRSIKKSSSNFQTQQTLIRETPRQNLNPKQKQLLMTNNSSNMKSTQIGVSRNQNLTKDRTNSQINTTVGNSIQQNVSQKPPKRYMSPGGLHQQNTMHEQKLNAIQKLYSTKHVSNKPTSYTKVNNIAGASINQSSIVQQSLSTTNFTYGKTNTIKQSNKRVGRKQQSPRQQSKESFTAKATYRNESKASFEGSNGSQNTRKQIPIAQTVPRNEMIHVKVINQFKPESHLAKSSSNLPQSKKNQTKISKQTVMNSTSSLINITLNDDHSQERLRMLKQLSQDISIAGMLGAHNQMSQSRSGHISNQVSSMSMAADSLKRTLKNVKVLQQQAHY